MIPTESWKSSAGETVAVEETQAITKGTPNDKSPRAAGPTPMTEDMAELMLKYGFATGGYGDTWADLLCEFDWQLKERSDKLAALAQRIAVQDAPTPTSGWQAQEQLISELEEQLAEANALAKKHEQTVVALLIGMREQRKAREDAEFQAQLWSNRCAEQRKALEEAENHFKEVLGQSVRRAEAAERKYLLLSAQYARLCDQVYEEDGETLKHVAAKARLAQIKRETVGRCKEKILAHAFFGITTPASLALELDELLLKEHT